MFMDWAISFLMNLRWHWEFFGIYRLIFILTPFVLKWSARGRIRTHGMQASEALKAPAFPDLATLAYVFGALCSFFAVLFSKKYSAEGAIWTLDVRRQGNSNPPLYQTETPRHVVLFFCTTFSLMQSSPLVTPAGFEPTPPGFPEDCRGAIPVRAWRTTNYSTGSWWFFFPYFFHRQGIVPKAGLKGFEPLTTWLKAKRSTYLSYRPILLFLPYFFLHRQGCNPLFDVLFSKKYSGPGRIRTRVSPA